MDDALFKHPEVLQAMPGVAIGGKAAGLLRLHAVGAPVPPWVVLPADLALGDDPALPAQLERLFAELSPDGAGVAVRSSSLSEDLAGASAAGIYETRFCSEASELSPAIARVRDSANAIRASAYAASNPPASMAVIVQRRIAPILSGVAFSAHPARARYDRVLVEAVHGSCESLVDGSATPSQFEFAVDCARIVSTEVSADGPEFLNEALVAELVGWLLKLEALFDTALDIEWAVDDSGFWLLQARPITRLALAAELCPPVAATSWFFDQRFHEPIRPITRTSLLPIIVKTGIVEALELRRMTSPEPLCFDYAGQVYINLKAYQDLLGNLPAWLLTRDLRQLFPDGTRPARLPGLGLLRTGIPVLWRERNRVLGNVRAWERFRDGLGARLAPIEEMETSTAKGWCEAWRELDALTEEFLCIHRWSIVLADYAYNAFLLAIRLLPRPVRERHHKRLTDRVRLVTAEANTARNHAPAMDKEARDTFLRACGQRSASLDYAAPVWAEAFGGRLEDAGTAPILLPSTPRRGVLVRLLEMREEQRYHWERILVRQRVLLLDAGEKLHKSGLLATAEDIWWLEWPELRSALESGQRPDPSVLLQRCRIHRINVPVRRPTHLRPGAESTAEMNRAIDGVTDLRGTGASGGRATGTACVCRRLKELPENLPEGCILVLPCLDPAWTPVLHRVAGLIIERGGLLSHAAIIAREYGIPLAIGVPEATELIRTGDRIQVDGETGTIGRH